MRYKGLDSLKAIAAFLVVCIHVPFPGVFGDYFEDICCLAVPCFFMITGFFYPTTMAKGKELKQIGKLTKLCFISLLAYFVWTFAFYKYTGQDFSYITSRLLSFNGIVKFLVFNNPFFVNHLWYLLAIVYVLVIVFIANKLKMKKLLMCSVPLLLLICIALGRYSNVFFGQFFSNDFSRNCYFFGLPFFCIGWFIAENHEKITSKLSKKLLLVLIVLFALMGPVEHFVLEMLGLNMEGDVFFSTPFFAISVFLYCAYYTEGNETLALIGKKYSTAIYIVHVAFIDLIYDLVSKTALHDAYDYVAPFVVFAFSLATAWAWKSLTERKAS